MINSKDRFTLRYHKTILACFACLLLFTYQECYGQSLIFSQYYFSPSNLNPAYTGLEKDIFFGVNYRSQWRNLQTPYNAALFSISYPLYVANPKPEHVGGIAFSVSKESAGVADMYHSLQGQLSAAYNLRLDAHKNKLVFGLQGSFVQNNINTEELQWGSQYDNIRGFDPGIMPSLGTLRDRVTYPSFSTGLIWHHTVARSYKRRGYQNHIGLSVANLNHPNTAFFANHQNRAPFVFRTSGGFTYHLRRMQVSHNALWVHSEEGYHINFGTYVTYALTSAYNTDLNSLKLSIGSWYRWEDAVVLALALQSTKINLALSYDFNSTFLDQNVPVGGAYEVSVAYRLSRKAAFNRQYGIPLM